MYRSVEQMGISSWRRSARAGLWMLMAAVCVLTAGVVAAQAQEVPKLHGSATGGGLGKLMPGRWGLVHASVTNPTDQDDVYRLLWWFDDAPNRQFVRQVWVPAGCQRRITWPVRYEGKMPANNGVDGRVRLMSLNQDRELAAAQSILMILDEPWLTAMISGDSELPTSGVMALRLAAGLGKRMTYPSDISHTLPRNVIGWQPTDMVVLARNEMELDAAQCRAMRQWLNSGGDIWVMLDQIDGEQLARWFADDAPLTEVDRVGLTKMQLKAVGEAVARHRDARQADEPVAVEQPMTLVRVLAAQQDGWEPMLMAGDWPAVVVRHVGAGRLIVSTVDARAWLDEHAEAARSAMARVIYPPMQPQRPLISDDSADAFARSQIGYEIAGRSLIAVVLGLYLLAFIVVGWIARRRGRAEGAVSIGIVMAAATTMVLLVIGYMQRGKVQATDALLQVVSAESGSSTALVRGRMTMFAPFTREAELHSDSGGWAWPVEEKDKALRRMVWTDTEAWKWQELKIDSGTTQIMHVRAQAKLAKPMSLLWSLDDKGLVASVTNEEASQWQDMVLSTDRAVCGVSRQAQADGAHVLRVGPGSVLPAGNYVAAGVMTQTQSQRNEMLKQAAGQLRAMEPTLLGWSGLIDDGLHDSEKVVQSGSALWMVPLRLATVAAGQHVVVPWPLVVMEPVANTGSGMVNALYDVRSKEFWPNSMSGSFVGQFTPPAQVQPLKLDHATLVLNMTAIGRQVKIKSVNGNKRVEIAMLDSPDGVFRIDLPVDQLTMRDGAVTLEVQVGDLQSGGQSAESQTAQWKIGQLGLELQGVVGK